MVFLKQVGREVFSSIITCSIYFHVHIQMFVKGLYVGAYGSNVFLQDSHVLT